MGNLIAFVNSFLSYLLLFALTVVLAAAAVCLGIRLRKRKEEKEALLTTARAEGEAGGPAQKTE